MFFSKPIKEISVHQLKEMRDRQADFQLIDVREPDEYQRCHIDGEHIPKGDIPQSVDQVERDKQVVIMCRSGRRSADVVDYLQKKHGLENVYNLKGGILAWADEIDPSVPKY